MAAFLLLPVVAACSSGSTTASSTPPPSASTTHVTGSSSSAQTTGPSDRAAEAAITAYKKYYAAEAAAAKNPAGSHGSYKGAQDFVSYSFDPLRGQILSELLNYRSRGLKTVGDPGHPRVTVDQVAPTRVILKDCPTTGGDWRTVYAKTGKRYGTPPPSSFPKPPYLATVTMVKVKNHWGASKITYDSSKTCVPDQR